jgi:hypothetical protein
MKPLVLIFTLTISVQAAVTNTDLLATVTNTPGCLAFWDFVKREADGAYRFTAHVPANATNEFALDAGNYIKDYWGAGRLAMPGRYSYLRP